MQELINQLRCTYEPLLECDYLTFNQAADLIESQAAEIAKYRALCDQLGDALEEAMYANSTEVSIDKFSKALEAWKELK